MTAKIVKHDKLLDENGRHQKYDSQYGSLFKFSVELDNGKKGIINSKTENGNYNVGDLVEYQLNDKGYVNKIKKPFSGSAQGVGKSNKQVALECAVILASRDQIQVKDIQMYSNNFLKYLEQ